MMMMEVAEGRLDGYNPSEGEEPPAVAEGQTTVDDQLAELSGQGEPAKPVEEREDPAPDPAPKRSGAPIRTYVVLEEGHFEEDNSSYYTEVGRVDARNATNAIRKAFRELSTGEEDKTLAVVPAKMWRPTPVRLKRSESVSVSIGS